MGRGEITLSSWERFLLMLIGVGILFLLSVLHSIDTHCAAIDKALSKPTTSVEATK